MSTPKICADFETQLSTAVAVGGTSFSLASATDDDGVALPAGLYYFTVDNGSTQKEYLAGTLSGTSVTTVLSVSRQGVETSGAVRAHRVGASVIISDFATYLNYMNGIALVSAPDASAIAKGVVEIATQAEYDAGTATGGTGAALAPTPAVIRGKKYNDYVVDTGTANTYAIAPSPVISAYATGQIFTFKAVNANSGASTLNVNALGAKTLKRADGTALLSGSITANQVLTAVYDGTDFIIISDLPPITPTVQRFTVSGTYTKPAGVKYVTVEVQAAGGNGGTDGSGGGGGGYNKKAIAASAIGATETVTIGTAGLGSGNTSFGALLTAANGTNASGTTQGVGGTATGGDVNIPGEDGAFMSLSGFGGAGGDSFYGYGAPINVNNNSTAVRNGTNGFGYGAGGSGGASATDGSPSGGTGGIGTAGLIIVTEYYS